MLSALLRVGGIGDGLFVIFFFLGLSVLICAVGLRTDRPRYACPSRAPVQGAYG